MSRRRRTRRRLAVELAAIWLGIPLAYRFELIPIHIFALLWVVAAVCLVVLIFDDRFRMKELVDVRPLRRHLKRIVPRFLVLGFGLTLLVAVLTPELLFSFVRQRPDIWAVVMIAYPLVSVYPQGLVLRAFLMHRYRPLFRSRWTRIAVSAVAFSFMHIILRNPVAVGLTLIGGVLFADTHLRSRSLVVSSVEHAMYGCLLFTVGWGRYFYHGANIPM